MMKLRVEGLTLAKKDMWADDALRPGGGQHLNERPSSIFRRRDRPQRAQVATPHRAVR